MMLRGFVQAGGGSTRFGTDGALVQIAGQAAFDSGVRKVTKAMKRLPIEVLDDPAWKRFDTEGRLFWNINTQADFAKARRIRETLDR
jgi:molybdopterin-guanine dinucleotide biosynthesis protein A